MTCIKQIEPESYKVTISKGKFKADVIMTMSHASDLDVECDFTIKYGDHVIKDDYSCFETPGEALCDVLDEIETLEDFEELLK